MVAKHLKIRRNRNKNKTQQKWHANVFWRSILFYHPTLHETFGWNNLTLVEKGTWSGRLGNPTYHVNAMRDFMDRRLSQLSGLPHTRGPPPSCKQALNPRTYMQSHTPTVVQGGRGWWQFFETILPSVESLWYSLQDGYMFYGWWHCWRSVTSLNMVAILDFIKS